MSRKGRHKRWRLGRAGISTVAQERQTATWAKGNTERAVAGSLDGALGEIMRRRDAFSRKRSEEERERVRAKKESKLGLKSYALDPDEERQWYIDHNLEIPRRLRRLTDEPS